MRLEVIDQGRIERFALIDSSAGKDIDGRTYIGGYHFNCGFYEEIWFDKSVWNVETLPTRHDVPAYRLTRKEGA